MDNDCDGEVDNFTRLTTCGTGACASNGTETCTAGSWGGDTCTEGPSSDEICDNIDNDCNTLIDDGLTQETTCGTGACASTGIITCTEGSWQSDTCSPGTPGPIDICEGSIDEDCDGNVDNDCDCTNGNTRQTTCGVGECENTVTETCEYNGQWSGCTPGSAVPEICDNKDNDCNGTPDDNVTQQTSCGQGACASTGIETCSGGVFSGDTCVPGTAEPNETCNNIDDDCDGTVDEDLTQPSTCGVGECASTGIETCSGGIWNNDTCVPGESSPEICNNKDDNCNELVDEGFDISTTCGVGACASTGNQTCTGGVLSDTCAAGSPAADDVTCDDIDDNCNGYVDEGTVPYGSTCGTGVCASTGTVTCTGGSWVDDCEEGDPGNYSENFNGTSMTNTGDNKNFILTGSSGDGNDWTIYRSSTGLSVSLEDNNDLGTDSQYLKVGNQCCSKREVKLTKTFPAGTYITSISVLTRTTGCAMYVEGELFIDGAKQGGNFVRYCSTSLLTTTWNINAEVGEIYLRWDDLRYSGSYSIDNIVINTSCGP